MYLKSIFLSNFRNYNTLSLDLDKHINIIYGNNAQGKTNLLESIYVLAFTKSHRSFIDNNLIKNGCDNCKIRGVVVKDSINSNLSVLSLTNNNPVGGRYECKSGFIYGEMPPYSKDELSDNEIWYVE